VIGKTADYAIVGIDIADGYFGGSRLREFIPFSL
jgi:hypothetical protein